MVNHCMPFTKYRQIIIFNLLKETQWNTQDMVTHLAGLEISLLWLLDQEKKKIILKWSVRCIIPILIFGLKCLIWTLADTIIVHVRLTTNMFLYSVVLQIQQENILNIFFILFIKRLWRIINYVFYY